jgi:hypothetical protein
VNPPYFFDLLQQILLSRLPAAIVFVAGRNRSILLQNEASAPQLLPIKKSA